MICWRNVAGVVAAVLGVYLFVMCQRLVANHGHNAPSWAAFGALVGLLLMVVPFYVVLWGAIKRKRDATSGADVRGTGRGDR